MSKAFTKETDDDDEPALSDDAGMPDGFTNYVTPAGHKKLNDELARLWKVDRPKLVDTIAWAASNGDRSENGDYIYGKRKLREIDRRIRFLSKRLDSAVVVDNAGKIHDRVYFGATVTDESGAERTISIVGVDELDPGRGRVSWISPVATRLPRSLGDAGRVETGWVWAQFGHGGAVLALARNHPRLPAMTASSYLLPEVEADLKRRMVFVAGPRQVGKAWQIHATGAKDYQTPDGIRIAPALELLRTLG
jgi:transcription elongation factor GreB